MKRGLYYLLVSSLILLLCLGARPLDVASGQTNTYVAKTSDDLEIYIQNLYQNINGEYYNLNYEAFRYAVLGYSSMLHTVGLKNPTKLTIIDFTKESKEKRFYTIDVEKQEIVHCSLVSHGQKSGGNICSQFSDIPESHQSSIGFYTTGQTYIGKHGISLRLHGNERGYNANAYKRAVVIHGADYVSEDFIRKNGRLGRSYGCPALPVELNEKIIKDIKGGSLIFAYYKDAKYLKTSKFLRNPQPYLVAKLLKKVSYSMNDSNS